MKTLSGKEVFQLYDTFSSALELTKEMVDSMGFKVDEEGFKKAQAQAVWSWRGERGRVPAPPDVDRYRDWKIETQSHRLFLFRRLLALRTSMRRFSARF